MCNPLHGFFQAIHTADLILKRGRSRPPSRENATPNEYYSRSRRSLTNDSTLSRRTDASDHMGNRKRIGARSRPPRQSHSSTGVFDSYHLHWPADVGPIFRSALYVEAGSALRALQAV